ncbi:MAG: hypothetical protein U0P81_06975 [Holophagaceae bacterium]
MADRPPTKKEIERWQFDRFALAFSGVPPGPVEETEEPDFIIGSGQLGIELTSLFHEPKANDRPLQEQESLQLNIVNSARRQYADLGLPPLHVSVHFNAHHSLRKADVPRLANQLCEWVQRNIPAIGSSIGEGYDWFNRDYFPEEVDQLKAWNLPGLTESEFTAPSCSWVPELSRADIERAVASKEPKLPSYRKRCSEVWLLICCDCGGLSTLFDVPELALEEAFATRFDRLFLFRLLPNKLHELRSIVPPNTEPAQSPP